MSTESRAHGNRLNHDPEHLRPRFDLGRSIAVFEDGQIVGGCHSHLLEMSIPGGAATVVIPTLAAESQHVTRGGQPAVVLLSTEEYDRLGR